MPLPTPTAGPPHNATCQRSPWTWTPSPARTPELGDYFSTHLTGAANGITLLAADPGTLTAGYVSNVAVFRTDLGKVASAPNLDAVTHGKIRVLGKDSTLTGAIDQKSVRLGGVPAQRLMYVFKAGANSVHVRSYLLVKDIGDKRIEYELTLAATVSDYARLFDKISGSFALVKSSGAHPTPSTSGGTTGNSSQTPPQPSPSG